MNSRKIRVAIADNHPMYLESVRRVLGAHPGFEVAGQGGSADDAVRLAGDLVPDLLILDTSMPRGIDAAALIAGRFPEIVVVALTASDAEDDVIGALGGGVRAYLVKDVTGGELLRILREVHGGAGYLAPSAAARLGRVR
jgi:two-component system, NarL family, nitrate/nitrite response regulator NarL